MRISVNEHAGWRRPIVAKHEECYDLTTEYTGRRSVRHILTDRYQFEDLTRFANGEACGECLEVFPAKPSSSTVHLFAPVYDKPGQRLPWRKRVSEGCCPVCGTEVSTEMFQQMHQGTLPRIPDINDRHADLEDEERRANSKKRRRG